MEDLTLILLAAGESNRFRDGKFFCKKQWIRVGKDPLWLYVAKRFLKKAKFNKVIVVGNKDELSYMRSFSNDIEFVSGGDERAKSLKNALDVVTSPYVLVSDVARAKTPFKIVKKLYKKRAKFDSISPYLPVFDTTYEELNLIDRELLKLIQTPQLSKTQLLKKALSKEAHFSDDSSAIKSVGGSLGFVKGSKKSTKITKFKDLKSFKFEPPTNEQRVGIGFDVHRLESGNGIALCGVLIPCEFKFIAHSDGDVALHAIIDALLGAANMGDIGKLYPDSDEKFKGIDSTKLLKDSFRRISEVGYVVVNVDLTIAAQEPKLMNYKEEMSRKVASLLNLEPNRVNIKASTTEKLGFVGRQEGILALALVTLRFFDWSKR